MTREDYIALIEVSDAIEQLDRGFENWLGVGHVGGNLDGLDRLYGVLLRNANKCYSNDGEGAEQLFFVVFFLIMCIIILIGAPTPLNDVQNGGTFFMEDLCKYKHQRHINNKYKN